jgi:hypothetical protein
MRKVAWAAARLVLLLLGGVVVGFLALVAVYALPTEPIAQQVRLSVQAFDGSWQTGEIPYEQLVKGYQTTQLDNTTDATMLMAAAHENDQPLLRRAVNVPTYTYRGMYSALIEYGQSGTENLRSSNSARYWLGFLVWLKPLLYLFSYMDIRMALLCAQLLLLVAVVAAMAHRGLTRATPALAVALLAVTPSVIGFSMQFSSVYILMLTATLLLLWRPALVISRVRAAAFFLLTGMATTYFDYLTYPVATFGLPFLTAMLLCPVGSKADGLRRFALLLAAWLAGYFGMWAGKWVLAALFSGDAWFWPNLFAKVAERGAMQSEGTSISLVAVYAAVLRVFAKRAYLMLTAALATVYAVLLARKAVRGRRPGAQVKPVSNAPWRASWPAMMLTSLMPFVWYVFTANHTFNHAFFTSRALVVTVFAAALMLSAPLGGLMPSPIGAVYPAVPASGGSEPDARPVPYLLCPLSPDQFGAQTDISRPTRYKRTATPLPGCRGSFFAA